MKGAFGGAVSILIGASLLLIFSAHPAHADISTKPRVVIYGDSLTEADQAYIAEKFDQPKVDLVWHFAFGSALCQWLPSMAAEAQTKTTAVIIEFAGNSNILTPCMVDPTTGQLDAQGSDKWLAKYTADAQQAQATWSAAGVPTYFTQNPPLPSSYGSDAGNINTYRLNILYQSIANHFVKAGATVANDDGSFTFWKKCDSTDAQCGVGGTKPPPVGSNQVRSADSTHFCPTDPVSPCIAPYSPGAARFGHAVGQVVARDLGVAPK